MIGESPQELAPVGHFRLSEGKFKAVERWAKLRLIVNGLIISYCLLLVY